MLRLFDQETPKKWLGKLLSMQTTSILAIAILVVGLAASSESVRHSFWDGAASVRAGVAWFYAHAVRVTTDMDRNVEEILGNSPTPGLLYIDTPQVYTRERLVNDRFNQANWLNERLADTSGKGFAKLFDRAQSSEKKNDQTNVAVGASGTASDGQATTGNQISEEPAVKNLALDPLDRFHRSLAYRAELRNELMGTLLDDGHDIDGNTLYRLNFDAVASPWRIDNDDAASALFIIKATHTDRQSHENADTVQRLEDDLALLRDWERQIQSFLNRILTFRTGSFKNEGMLSSPTDPKEQAAFYWFLRTKMVENFLSLLARNLDITFNCDFEDQECSNANTDFAKINQKDPYKDRYDVIAKWLGLEYSVNKPSPDFTDDRHSQSFQRSLQQARLVNDAWYFDGLLRYDKDCAVKLGLILATDLPTPKSSEETTGTQTEGESVGDKEESTAASENGQSASGSTESDGEDRCRPPLDHSGQRALLRIIAAVNAMHTGLSKPMTRERFKKLFTFDFDRNGSNGQPKGFIKLMDEFIQVTPETDDINTWLTERIGQRRETLKAAKNNEQREKPHPDIRNLIDTNLDIEKCQGETEFASWGRCNFIRTKSSDYVETVIAEFIKLRVTNEHPLYSPVDSMANFIDLGLTGCAFANCTFEVRRRETLPELKDIRVDRKDGLQCRMDALKHPQVSKHFDRLMHLDGSEDLDKTTRDSVTILRYALANPDFSKVLTELSNDDLSEHLNALENIEIKDALEGFSPKTNRDYVELVMACHLRHWLKKERNHLTVYDVSPRTHSEVTLGEQRRANEIAAKLPLLLRPESDGQIDLTIKQVSELVRSNKSAQPFVIGFGQVGNANGAEASRPRNETVFGWLVHARPGANGRQARGHHRMSAVLSVPSWWKRIEFDVTGCWIGRGLVKFSKLRNINEPADICRRDSPHSDDQASAENRKNVLERTFRVQLPRRVEDVTERFELDVIKAPYFDFDWARKYNTNLSLEVGRPGQLVLVGARLWRGTVVTVGNQRADSISVLPDMKGVIAEFDCVKPAPGTTGTKISSDTKSPVIVWTSEGRTDELYVDLRHFTGREDEQKPCFHPDHPNFRQP